MQYQSTRNNNISVSSAEAIIKGISPDGGLFVPMQKPRLSIEDINSLAKVGYAERAKIVLGLFLTDYTMQEISESVANAYNKQKFETDSIAPVYELTESTYILELWHGPTCAFKDMALQMLPQLLTRAMKKTGEKREVVILVATSGDTGKAALEGFSDVEGTKIMVFYPQEGVSQIQRLQMITQDGDNVGVSGIYGNFDDAQNGVKAIFNDVEFNKLLDQSGYVLSSANSINWGRLAPQIIYYVSAYSDLLRAERIKPGEKVNIVVPTGNFGNILAAYYAKEMGLPISKLICASNINNVLTDFIATGIYDRKRDFKTTVSPSMDILISSNLERFLFDITKDAALIKGWMQELSTNGRYEITQEAKAIIKELFYGGFCNDEDTKATIAKVWKEHSYLMDTHTAVGMKVYESYVNETGDNTKTIIASTASPFKFNGSVLEAIDKNFVDTDDEFVLLDRLSELSGQKVPYSLSELIDKQKRFDQKCTKEAMSSSVKAFLGIK